MKHDHQCHGNQPNVQLPHEILRDQRHEIPRDHDHHDILQNGNLMPQPLHGAVQQDWNELAHKVNGVPLPYGIRQHDQSLHRHDHLPHGPNVQHYLDTQYVHLCGDRLRVEDDRMENVDLPHSHLLLFLLPL